MSFAMPVAAPNPNVTPFSFNNNEEQPDVRARLHHPGRANSHDPAEATAPDASPAGVAADADVKFTVTAHDGRLHEDGVIDTDRNTAVAMHLSPLAFIWIGPFAMAIPLVLWLMRKEHSRFADDHGRETVNFMISFVVLNVLLALTVVGIVLIPVLWVVAVVGLIRGAMAAGRNEYFRYPVNIRFL